MKKVEIPTQVSAERTTKNLYFLTLSRRCEQSTLIFTKAIRSFQRTFFWESVVKLSSNLLEI